MTNFSLQDLELIIAQRAKSKDVNSYTAKLIQSGERRILQKFGEEATEFLIAALGTDRQEKIDEAADLIYHLLVVLNVNEINFSDILSCLEKRRHRSGLDEKASRNEK